MNIGQDKLILYSSLQSYNFFCISQARWHYVCLIYFSWSNIELNWFRFIFRSKYNALCDTSVDDRAAHPVISFKLYVLIPMTT